MIDSLRTLFVHRARRYRFDVFALLWLPYAYLVWRFWFVTDDAYVSFRYSRNLALGQGLRYNLGDHVPVEGYSNFLWVIVGSLFEFLRLEITFWMPLLSALCGTVLLFLVFDLLRRRLGISLFIASIATLTLGFYPPFALWSTSGLATAPFALLVYLTFERLVLRTEGVDVVGASIFGILTALLRVEGIAWVAVIAVLAFASRWIARQRKIKPFVLFALCVAVGCAIYLGWRYWYYRELLPNSVCAKTGLPLGYMKRGFDYVAVQFLTFLTPFLVLITSFFALRRKRIAIGLPVAAMAWAFPAYSIVATGDFMAMGRFLVPGLAFNTILLAWLFDDLADNSLARRAATGLLGAATIVIGALPGWNQHLVPAEVLAKFHFRHNKRIQRSEYAQWEFQRDNLLAQVGRALKAYAPKKLEPNASIVFQGIGALGYYSDLFIYDQFGLVTPTVARRKVSSSGRMFSPGHDKNVDLRFFLGYKPTLLRAVIVSGAEARVVANKIRSSAGALRAIWPERQLEREYVPDFVQLEAKNRSSQPQVLIVWRRLDAHEDWQGQWRGFAKRLRDLSESMD